MLLKLKFEKQSAVGHESLNSKSNACFLLLKIQRMIVQNLSEIT